jgi:hypothetical protein
MRRILVILSIALLVPQAAHAANAQVAGLQVALRASGDYCGPVDGIAGPATAAAVRQFQARAGLPVDGIAGLATRRALGRLGTPLLGRRLIARGAVGWDVSVLEFLLARRKLLSWDIDGVFDARTERALRRLQRTVGLPADGIVGPLTLRALRGGIAVPLAAPQQPRSATVPELIDRYAARYAVDPALARALAWMESGFRPDLVSSAGARGVMQLLPETTDFVETVLLGRELPDTVEAQVHAGVVLLRHLLREFGGDERLALAAWLQGARGVRERGPLPEAREFAADVLALKGRV